VLTAIQYEAETLMMYRTQVERRIHTYMMREMRTENVTRQDKVTSEDIPKLAGLPSMADILIKKGPWWLSHAHIE